MRVRFWGNPGGGFCHWVRLDLTTEELQYMSVLVAHDVREDRIQGLASLPERHAETLGKLRRALGQE